MSTATTPQPQQQPARARLLAAADDLFYAHGINATGVDALIAAADVARMTFYRHFRGKDDLIAAYLHARDARWRATLDQAITSAGNDPSQQLLAVFDALHTWHTNPQFRGCSFANAAAELSDTDHPARAAIAAHKRALRDRIHLIATSTAHPTPDLLVDQLMMLFEGATTTQALGEVSDAARKARATAQTLLHTTT